MVVFYLFEARNQNRSFVMPYSGLNSVVLQQCWNAAYFGLAVMVREQYFGLDGFCHLDELIDGHGVRLVAGQEGDVDVMDVGHFRDVFGVAGDVDPQSIEG